MQGGDAVPGDAHKCTHDTHTQKHTHTHTHTRTRKIDVLWSHINSVQPHHLFSLFSSFSLFEGLFSSFFSFFVASHVPFACKPLRNPTCSLFRTLGTCCSPVISVLLSHIMCCSVLQCVAVCRSVLQCAVECCSVLQSVTSSFFSWVTSSLCSHIIGQKKNPHWQKKRIH